LFLLDLTHYRDLKGVPVSIEENFKKEIKKTTKQIA